jgi:hypothetical protein
MDTKTNHKTGDPASGMDSHNANEKLKESIDFLVELFTKASHKMDELVEHAGMYRFPKNLKEIYEVFRHKIQHEDSLVNHRLTWLLQCQALLIAAAGFGYKTDNIRNDDFIKHGIFYIFLLGLLTSGCILITVFAAWRAMCKVTSHFHKCIEDFEGEQCIESGTLNKYDIRVDVTPEIAKGGIFGAIALPVLFVLFWLILIIIYPYKWQFLHF